MEKGDIRRLQLLEVALDEFISKGYYGTSTREIARKANVSSGLLFHYFPSKESVYLELIKIGTEKMMIDEKKSMDAPKEYLNQTICYILNRIEHDTFFAKMFVFINNAQFTLVEISEVRALLEHAEIGEQWIPVIRKGQEQQLFCEGNPHALCLLIFGALQGIVQEKVRNPESPIPKAEWLMKIILKED